MSIGHRFQGRICHPARVRTRCAKVLLTLGCTVAVAACGSSSQSRSSLTTAASSQTSGSATTPAPNGEASRSAAQILADAARAVHSAHSYQLEATISEHHRTQRLRLVTAPANSLELTGAMGPAAYQVISVPSGTFTRGNAAFWRQKDPAHASLLADRWIRLPPSAARDLLATFAQLDAANMSRCLVEDHGQLSLAGHTTVGGRPAVVIRDAGNVPGGQPGELAVAATGPPYPLRLTTSGPQRAGGRVDVCNDGKAGGAEGSLSFSQFNRVRAILAPVGNE
jgi:hypothetical protein